MATAAHQDIRYTTPLICKEVKARAQNLPGNFYAESYDSIPEVDVVDMDGTDLSGLLSKGLAFDFLDNNVIIRLKNKCAVTKAVLLKESKSDEIKYSFKEKFELMSPYFNGLSLDEATARMENSLNQIASLKPDDIILELAFDGTIFYKVWKNDFLFFYNHLIIDSEDENDDEVVLTIFKGEEKLPSYAGSLKDANKFLKEAIV